MPQQGVSPRLLTQGMERDAVCLSFLTQATASQGEGEKAQALSEGGKEVWWASSHYSLSHTPSPMQTAQCSGAGTRDPSPRPKSSPGHKKGPAVPQPSCLDNRSQEKDFPNIKTSTLVFFSHILLCNGILEGADQSQDPAHS